MVRKLAASIWHVIGQGVFAMGTSDISFRESAGALCEHLNCLNERLAIQEILDDSRSAVMGDC